MIIKRICGLDEAGRGSLAGPLVAAAVILHCRRNVISRKAGIIVRDSKTLNSKQRKKIYSVLKKLKAEIFIEIISTRSINNHGIGWANKEIFRRLIKKITADQFIVDGNLHIGRIAGKTNTVKSVVHADAYIAEVMAAGIVAKVERDTIMYGLHRRFPKFDWKYNAGYGTRSHIAAIRKYTVTRYHRGIFVTTALRKLY
jgi:ribonuclease HII